MGTIRIKRSVTNWIKLKLNSPTDKKQSEEMEVDKLEDTLMNNWRELERMLVCSKVSFCANRYTKELPNRSCECDGQSDPEPHHHPVPHQRHHQQADTWLIQRR